MPNRQWRRHTRRATTIIKSSVFNQTRTLLS